MKTKFLLAAAFLLGSVTVATAQISPDAPQRSGSVNQTTLPPTNPASANNPGTISQTTPTRANPPQQRVIGTIDERPLPAQTTTTIKQNMRQTTPASRATPENKRRATPQSTQPRRSATPANTTRP
ncbi:hypothetical protein MUN84_15475 [Hymenobacter sp. 5516J-16]|uniref:hypothetical protein n=1 Tax=Hymenobacter sp. 5516J-16 TaxID=2932253 RepID=UPI001FD3E041|nr:hypothetical protein [Hymenobacter sp. 5516J-16]UOQ76009.1 hypothetical protein MUN84_15475 [Hymenobacter sp. 5516J-16]